MASFYSGTFSTLLSFAIFRSSGDEGVRLRLPVLLSLFKYFRCSQSLLLHFDFLWYSAFILVTQSLLSLICPAPGCLKIPTLSLQPIRQLEGNLQIILIGRRLRENWEVLPLSGDKGAVCHLRQRLSFKVNCTAQATSSPLCLSWETNLPRCLCPLME